MTSHVTNGMDDPRETLPPSPAVLSRREMRRAVVERQLHSARAWLAGFRSPRRLLTAVGLVFAWCALWGSISAANVVSGAVVAVVALRLGQRETGAGRIRLRPLGRLTALVASDMVKSTVAVIREVLTPTDYTQEGIIGVALPASSREHLLLLFVSITVTPGTAVVAAESDGSVLYLHVLHCDRREETEAHVRQLAELADAALPVADRGGST